jgi:diguanylate cyclase (GGDEF)-like protein
MSIMFDLNNLKRANDTYGHAVGDQLITNFARLLRNAIPAKDFVGRYGGDEFIAIITQTTKKSLISWMKCMMRLNISMKTYIRWK